MGGSAFASASHDGPPLNVPRLPTVQYLPLRHTYHACLKCFFQIVVTPMEAPGKVDHGDIDYLVTGHLHDFQVEDLAVAFGATRYIAGPTINFAVPISGNEKRHAQIDVQICPSLTTLRWRAFKNGYGDMWQILGIMIRPFGLTADHRGLHVRVAEIEPTNRKASMIFLTISPPEVLEFLGLNVESFKCGFKNEEGLFTWIRNGRFFDSYDLRGEHQNANDRQRRKKRVMFCRFADEWAPRHPRLSGEIPLSTRDEVFEEVLDRFNVRQSYELAIDAHRQEKREKEFWQSVGSGLSLGDKGTKHAVRELKKILTFQDRNLVMEQRVGSDAEQEMRMMDMSNMSNSELVNMAIERWQHMASARRIWYSFADTTRH